MNTTLHRYEYHVWANDRVFRHLSELPAKTAEQPITSVFASLFETLVHMYRVDTVRLYAMSDRGAEIMRRVQQIAEQTKGMNVTDLAALFHDLYEETRKFLRQQDARTVRPYQHPQYGTLHATYDDIVHHIVNHGTYHRGNLTAMLRQLGHTGVPTDYVFYLYEFPNVTE